MNRGLAALAAAAAVALAGCGSSATPAIKVTTPAPVPVAAQVAERIGATGCAQERNHGQGLFWVTGCTATWHGRKVGISTFANEPGRDGWLQAAGAVGGVVPLIEGPTWVVYPSVRSRT